MRESSSRAVPSSSDGPGRAPGAVGLLRGAAGLPVGSWDHGEDDPALSGDSLRIEPDSLLDGRFHGPRINTAMAMAMGRKRRWILYSVVFLALLIATVVAGALARRLWSSLSVELMAVEALLAFWIGRVLLPGRRAAQAGQEDAAVGRR